MRRPRGLVPHPTGAEGKRSCRRAPAARLEGVQVFHACMGPFAQILTRSALIAAFGDDTTAILTYDIDTLPVRDAPGAEYVTVTVTAGKITRMRIIFARAPSRRPAEPQQSPSPP